MSTHERDRGTASHATPPTPERSTRAGGGSTTRDLPARPSHELPQEAPRAVQEALVVQLKESAATQYGFERDPFGVGPVQCERASAPTRSPEDTVAIAADGVTGSSSSLPHAQAIQTSFGIHDVSGIEAHVGGSAANAADAIGATAYATGNRVAFKQAPDLHTAAHEAAHVVQQRGGVQLKGGVGESGDAYEQHADAVADRVVRGESASDLLASYGGARASSPLVQRRDSASGASTASPEPAGPTPRTTGFPVVDQGYACERADGGDCFLDSRQRGDVTNELGHRITTANSSFHDAITHVRLDLLLAKEGGWGFVSELIFNVLSFTAVGALVKGAAMLKKAATVRDALAVLQLPATGSAMESIRDRVASLDTGQVEGVLAHISKAVRAELKSSASKLPPEKTARAMFLDEVGVAQGKYLEAMRMQAPASLDDGQLIALTHAYAYENHTVPAYRDQLTDLIARYQSHGIEDLGANETGRRHLVRFRAYGQERLAIVQVNDRRELFKYRGEAYHADGRSIFVQWIDADLMEAAEQMNESRNGTPPVIEAGHRLNIFGNRHVHGFTDAHGDEPRELNAWIDDAGGVDA